MQCDATSVLSFWCEAAGSSAGKWSVLWSGWRTGLTAGTTVVGTVPFLIRTSCALIFVLLLVLVCRH